jgi:predicted lipid-binding transport protein (Tim44 family)
MTRFQIIQSQDTTPDAHEILSPPPRRFWRLKAGLAALLMASAVIGLVLAALFLGSVIASLLVILMLIVSVVAAIKAVVRHVARIRDRRRQYVAREC